MFYNMTVPPNLRTPIGTQESPRLRRVAQSWMNWRSLVVAVDRRFPSNKPPVVIKCNNLNPRHGRSSRSEPSNTAKQYLGVSSWSELSGVLKRAAPWRSWWFPCLRQSCRSEDRDLLVADILRSSLECVDIGNRRIPGEQASSFSQMLDTNSPWATCFTHLQDGCIMKSPWVTHNVSRKFLAAALNECTPDSSAKGRTVSGFRSA